LIGKDSASTVIDFGGAGRSVYAQNLVGVTIRDLAVTRGLHGICFYNTDSSTIQRVNSYTNTECALLLRSGSTGNALTGNCGAGSAIGLYLLHSSDSNVVTNNRLHDNSNCGIANDECDRNRFTGNTASGNNRGIAIFSSDTLVVEGNACTGNASHGLELHTALFNTLRGNRLFSNGGSGLNLIDARDNEVWQNNSDSNGGYAVNLTGSTASDTFSKNNLAGAPASPAAIVANATGNAFTFTQNWWGSTDTSVIRAAISGAGAAAVTYWPFRLGAVDTAALADSIAPAAPAAVTMTSGTTSVTVTWTASAGSEEIGGGAPGDLAGYRVYRSATLDTTYWQWAGNAAGTTFIDSGMGAGNWYYRVTAYDNHAPWPNESFYSDSRQAGVLDVTPCTVTISAVPHTTTAAWGCMGTVRDNGIDTPATVAVRLNGTDQGTAPVTGETGEFGLILNLTIGVNTVRVTATDSMGNTGVAVFSVVYSLTETTVTAGDPVNVPLSDTAGGGVLVNVTGGNDTALIVVTNTGGGDSITVSVDFAGSGYSIYVEKLDTATLANSFGISTTLNGISSTDYNLLDSAVLKVTVIDSTGNVVSGNTANYDAITLHWYYGALAAAQES
ncbi:MAG TPA: right-handed parallel beta-helix repeat-containing protein, partial [bacterium]|nr:right-handed parallel beta-helix repeat-containing protein [bacterium]